MQLGVDFDHSTLSQEAAELGIVPRDYQSEAQVRSFEAWRKPLRGVLVRSPTGSGKTVTGCLTAKEWLEQGPQYRVMVVSHEKQLIWQFTDEVDDILGKWLAETFNSSVAVEMESQRVQVPPVPQIVVASRASLIIKESDLHECPRCPTEHTKPEPHCPPCRAILKKAGMCVWCGVQPAGNLGRSKDDRCPACQHAEMEIIRYPRLEKFDRDTYNWLLIIDEVHRWAWKLDSCRPILDWFDANPESRRLGLSATPERTDGTSLAKICPAIAADYRLFDIDGGKCAVKDGWAVPYDQRFVIVKGVDFKKLREKAGDFDKDQLDKDLSTTEALASMIKPTLDIVGDKRTIIFNAGTGQAKAVAAYINALSEENVKDGKEPYGEARELDGKAPPELRRETYESHKKGEFQFLSVCGLCREGYNDPAIGAVAIFRPSKSRPLVEQMKGRGCRPLRGLVNSKMTREERLRAIAASSKPACIVVDLVGVTGLADCASTAHILAGGKPDEVINRANQLAVKAAKENPQLSIDMAEKIHQAEAEIEKERQARADAEAARQKIQEEEEERRREARRQAGFGAEVEYDQHQVEQGHGGVAVKEKKGPVLPWGKRKGQPIRAQNDWMLDWIVTKSPYPDWVKGVARSEQALRAEAPDQSGPTMPTEKHNGHAVDLDEINAMLLSANRK